MAKLNDAALEQLGYMDLIVDELKKRSFGSKELAYPALCALRLRNALQAVKILVENGLVHDAMGALRSALEVVILIVGYYRIKDFKIRRHLDFIVDKKGLLNIRLEAKIFGPDEDETVLENLIKPLQEELTRNKERDILPFGDIHSIADGCGMVPFKKRFYKLLCMNTHPSTNIISKYADDSTPVKFVEKPEEDDVEHISEVIYNCVILAASILDENLKLGTQLPRIDEILATL